jgi:glyoxylase-like metal-dependent hydrolase (beta-lactamase superfamily II)
VPGGAPPAVRELLPARLKELGCPLGSVTDVVLTHLHIDHVGWASTAGRATFPDARHHIHAADWKHFVDGDADEAVRRKVAPLCEAAILWDGTESGFDWDAQAATAVRTRWSERLRAAGTPLAGPHFPGLEPITLH